MNYCGQCGAQLAPGSSFCVRCGAPHSVSGAVSAQPQTGPAQQPRTARVKRRRKWLYIIPAAALGIFVLLGIIGSLLPPTPADNKGAAAPAATSTPTHVTANQGHADELANIRGWNDALAMALRSCGVATGEIVWTRTASPSDLLGAGYTPQGICREQAEQVSFDTPPLYPGLDYNRLDTARHDIQAWARQLSSLWANKTGGDSTHNQLTADVLRDAGTTLVAQQEAKVGIRLDPHTLRPVGHPDNN